MDTKPLPKPRRTLTEEQLGKKRRIDKLKHRENRAENKTRLENIERDVSFLRDTIGDLILQLRQLGHGDAAPEQSSTTSHENGSSQHHHHHHLHHQAAHDDGSSQQHHHHSHQHLHHQAALSDQLVCLPKSEPWTSSPDTTPPFTAGGPSMPQVGAAYYDPAADPITQRLYAQHIFPQQPLESHMDMEALLAEIRGQQPVVECRCGKPHSADVQCTERIAVVMAAEFHNASNQTSMRAVTAARNPSLTDMLLHHTDVSNPLSAILSTILRQYEVSHVDTMCGVFFLTYRLLRWRYYPSAESQADVPTIMRPTQAQITIPHPKCIDFLPFPALRNHLCLNQHMDARHSVDLYLQSLRLTLPPGKSLMGKTERGCVELHPEFEVLASDLRNWSIGPPWSDCFPQLRQFLY